ncbi:putative cytochrome c oxidase subunit protein [Echria macrotheca]|uniref:Cytochrome c oxidase subunit 13, mitochondrial n=1 Tax=Echria macrotheca TaxID=438768 RepID=A0AAJ0BK85_9PEZI|nr:putative cytochrome c oxidase subunit protein [Echria macrotheca]
MFAQRQLLRGAPRLSAQLRTPLQRRLASSTPAQAGENAFIRERRAVKEHAAGTTELWRKISIYGCIPALLLAGWNAYNLWNEHWEHWSHMPPLEERVEYPYQNIRTRNFPWGDGDKTIFWNPTVNYHNKDKTT